MVINRRAFTGAWIETPLIHNKVSSVVVAPSQARGLKLTISNIRRCINQVAPSQARGLKHRRQVYLRLMMCRAFTGAWIETIHKHLILVVIKVAPSQARGLKHRV